MLKNRVLFIYANLLQSESISLGIAYLSAALKQSGYEVSLFDFTFTRNKQALKKKIKEFKPDYIGYSVRSGEYEYCRQLAHEVSIYYTGSQIIGGPHVSAVGAGAIDPVFDLVFTGEADLSIVHALDNNLTGKIDAIPVTDLVELPLPDYDLFDIQRHIAVSGRIEIASSRGCPYRCTYCGNGGNYAPDFRKKPARAFVDELKKTSRKYGVTKFSFYDEMFTLNKQWLKTFAYYMNGSGFTYLANAHPATMRDPEVAKLLKQSGCESVSIGIECGDEKYRKEMLNHGATDYDINNAFVSADNAGLPTYAYIMIGLPYETKAQVEDTVLLTKIMQPNHLQVSVFQPYPGTPLHDRLAADGKPINYSHSHQLLPKYNYACYNRTYLRYLKATTRFRVLRKHSPLKAVTLLFYDTFFPLLVYVRRFVPKGLKKLFLKVVG